MTAAKPQFVKGILSFYNKNKRDLPWRKTKDPYLIWVSEIILQQTRVQQGLPYYLRFVKTFPDVKSLAEAKESQVLKLWQGLGYYSRARNMHTAAKQIMNEFKGKFPRSLTDIKSLKGIGEYTSAAVSSFAFGEPNAVVDGNVQRLLTRYFKIEIIPDSTIGKKELSALANELIQKQIPSTFNQAIMEFGAMQCVPKNPNCKTCILAENCQALLFDQVHNLPLKKAKNKPHDRYFNYLVVSDKGNFYLNRRKENDIWKNLFEFPLIESAKKLNSSQLIKNKLFSQIDNSFAYDSIKKISSFTHKLSHQTIHADYFELSGSMKSKPKEWVKVSDAKIKKLPLSRLTEKFIAEYSYRKP